MSIWFTKNSKTHRLRIKGQKMIKDFINYVQSIEEEKQRLKVDYWENFLCSMQSCIGVIIMVLPFLILFSSSLSSFISLITTIGVSAGLAYFFIMKKGGEASASYRAIVEHRDLQLEKFLNNEKNELGDIERVSNPILVVLKINRLKGELTQQFKNIEKIKDYLITNNITLENSIEVGLDRTIRLTISELQEILDSDVELVYIEQLIDINKITNYTSKLNFSKKINEITRNNTYRNLYLKIVREQVLSAISMQDEGVSIINVPVLNVSLSEENVKELFQSHIELKTILNILGKDNIYKLKDYLTLLIRSDRIEELKSDTSISRDFLFYIKGKSLNTVQMQLMRELLPEHQYRIFKNNNTKKFNKFYSVQEFLIYWGNYKESIDMPEHSRALLEDIIREDLARLNEFKQTVNPLPEYQEQINNCENIILNKINKLLTNQEEVKYLTANK